MAGSRLTAGGEAVCGALYLRMCVGRGEEHSRGFQVAAKAHSQEWLCHGTPENRPSLLLPMRVNQPSPSLRDSMPVWALYPALRPGLKSSASLWDSRGEN